MFPTSITWFKNAICLNNIYIYLPSEYNLVQKRYIFKYIYMFPPNITSLKYAKYVFK